MFSNSKDKIENNVHYVSKFANPEYAKKILKNKIDSCTGSNWEETVAASVGKYVEQVLTMCGMVLRFCKNSNDGIVTLTKDALEHNVYRLYKNEIFHMSYKEYSEWIGNHGLKAKVYSRLSVRGI